MIRTSRAHVPMLAGLVIATGFVAACGTTKYADDDNAYVLELKSSTAATLAFKGMATECTYAKADKKLTVTCPQEPPLDFAIQPDGSLQAPGFPLVLKKK